MGDDGLGDGGRVSELHQAGVDGEQQREDGAHNEQQPAGMVTAYNVLCGNGAVDSVLEECDDGNFVPGDGCDSCRVAPVSPPPPGGGLIPPGGLVIPVAVGAAVLVIAGAAIVIVVRRRGGGTSRGRKDSINSTDGYGTRSRHASEATAPMHNADRMSMATGGTNATTFSNTRTIDLSTAETASAFSLGFSDF